MVLYNLQNVFRYILILRYKHHLTYWLWILILSNGNKWEMIRLQNNHRDASSHLHPFLDLKTQPCTAEWNGPRVPASFTPPPPDGKLCTLILSSTVTLQAFRSCFSLDFNLATTALSLSSVVTFALNEHIGKALKIQSCCLKQLELF